MSSKISLESLIKRAICDYLTIKGFFIWNNASTGVYDPVRKIFRKTNSRYQIKGVSDILGIHEGRLLAIEVKSPTGRLTPEQTKFIEEINNRGGIAFVARSVDDVVKNLKRFNVGD